MGGDPLFPAGKAETFLGGGLEIDLTDPDPHIFRQNPAHFGNVGHHLRLLGNDGGIQIGDLITLPANQLAHLFEKDLTVDPFEAIVVVGKMLTDIPQGSSTQKGIHNSMGQYICVTVAVKSPMEGDLYAANDDAS